MASRFHRRPAAIEGERVVQSKAVRRIYAQALEHSAFPHGLTRFSRGAQQSLDPLRLAPGFKAPHLARVFERPEQKGGRTHGQSDRAVNA